MQMPSSVYIVSVPYQISISKCVSHIATSHWHCLDETVLVRGMDMLLWRSRKYLRIITPNPITLFSSLNPHPHHPMAFPGAL